MIYEKITPPTEGKKISLDEKASLIVPEHVIIPSKNNFEKNCNLRFRKTNGKCDKSFMQWFQ